MSSYVEYPIKCITCNEPLAYLAGKYESLLREGNTIEEALNMLGITAYCSRISMMNPTFVPYNMENRKVIEGTANVELVEKLPDPVGEGGKVSFLQLTPLQLSERTDILITANPTNLIQHPVWTPPKATSVVIRPTAAVQPKPKIQTRMDFSRFVNQNQPQPVEINQMQSIDSEPLVRESTKPYDETESVLKLLEQYAIPTLQFTSGEFIYPQNVGFPTINDTGAEYMEVPVGNGYNCQILSGRTYLAR
jgi:DNA-directed RNA polymerase subunit N (RpoN/RPB10)